MSSKKPLKVVELFAGVGGFRLALEGHSDKKWSIPGCGFEVVWANQWEPPGTESKQFAFRCYVSHFDPNNEHSEQHSNEDIATVLDKMEAGDIEIPDHDILVGGFPCQDYSVAKTLQQAQGISGKKGVLWWEIYRLLKAKRPKYLLLENVDRMLKSPANQRGRDFAIMLSCLNSLGYSVEWRVVNAADYGFPQRRRRVYIYGEQTKKKWNLEKRIKQNGVLAQSLPIKTGMVIPKTITIPEDLIYITENFGIDEKTSVFQNAGAMQNGFASTMKVEANHSGLHMTLGDILVDEKDVPEEYFIPEEKIERWKYFKNSKKEERTDKKTGYRYIYAEGGMSFPDNTNLPSRTILTGEGGAGPSRFKHVVQTPSGRYRRLVPDELDQLQCFPKGWTDTGMTDSHRAFCMGNALVVGIIEKIGAAIRDGAAQGHK